MGANPTITNISGLGKPRLILVSARPRGSIVSSSVANPTVITTTLPHGLGNGQKVRIAGHSGSTPSINSDYAATVTGPKTFTIPVNVTVAGTGGTFEALTDFYESTGTTTFDATHAYETGAPAYTQVKVGNRISSYLVSGGLSYPTYAKVTAIAAGILTVDGWTNGTPTGGQIFRVDGWIADLPRCQEMTETFDPDQLVRSIWAGDQGSIKDTKFRGWKYTCVLDYSQYTSPDMLMDLRYILAMKTNDRLVLIPRIDAPQFQYNVYFAEKIDLTRFGYSPGYRKPAFVFAGKENLASWPIVQGYGYGYATNYGSQY